MALDLTYLVASAYLDAQDRFAKSDDTVAKLRLWFNDESPARFLDLEPSEFNALPREQRTLINEAGSAAGYLDTEGKSNA